jgi:hypothetical protein
MVLVERHWLRSLAGAVLVLSAVACTGTIEEPAGNRPGGSIIETPPGSEVVRAPLRRLTRFEYNNTVRDLFGDTTSPATALPSEESGNGFGNDADALSVSSLLVQQYSTVAEGVSERASTPENLARWSPCALSVTEATELSCAREILATLVPAMYRRPVDAAEIDELEVLRASMRGTSTFEGSIAGVIEALLQSPDFLYRPEFGVPDPARAHLRLPTGYEMASRLSYFLWATTPDEVLIAAAAAGELDTREGIRTHAARMLDDERSRPVIELFFDFLLNIATVAAAERSDELYPDFTPQIGALMRTETQRFLEHVIFEGDGDWPTALTAPYSFMNEPLARFYGIEGVTGDEFRRVDLDTAQRRGILTQGAFLVGSTHSNMTSPVKRGGFIVRELLCREIPLPTGDILEQVTPPDPYSGATARDRYSAHSEDPVCATCHQNMDPMGFALENFDAIGRWRDTENDVVIDASGSVPGSDMVVDGPTSLVQALAATEASNACFATHWMSFAYGRTVGGRNDDVLQETVDAEFADSGYDIRELILAVTQTDNFLALPAEPE